MACAAACLAVASLLPSAAGAEELALERDIAQRVNAHRQSIGRRALEVDPRISVIARSHSRRMAAGKTGLAHDGMRSRGAEISGFVPLRRMAENVSRHDRDRSEVPAAAVEGWTRSRVHRRNLEGDFALTGVGVAVSADGITYVTQIFVAPVPAAPAR